MDGDRGLENYGLTDEWLRKRLAGQVPADGLGPISETTWPAWEKALTSSNQTVRQAALLILNQPVDVDEADHLRALADQIEGLIRVFEATGERDVFRTLVRLAEAVEGSPALSWLVGQIAGDRLDDELAEEAALMERPISAGLLDDARGRETLYLLPCLFGCRASFSAAQILAVVRLRRRLDPSRITARWADISRLLEAGRLAEAVAQARPEWRPMILDRTDPAEPAARPGRALIWGNWDEEALAFWERVVEAWAGELKEVRRIAEQVSSKTGRAVIALFNANLAASLSWALPDPIDQAATAAGELVAAAERIKPEIAARLEGPDGLNLAEARLKRSIRPALQKGLTDLAVALRVNDRIDELDGWIDRTAKWFPDRPDPTASCPWPMEFRPVEALAEALEATLDRAEARTTGWTDSLAERLSLAAAGGEMIAAGRLKGLVVAITEKFSASTLAGQDWRYLADWLALLRAVAPEAVFLLFDDTNRADSSLAAVVARLENAVGLGPFGRASEKDPVESIAALAGPGRLFALRVLPQRRSGASLTSYLTQRDEAQLAAGVYDPCWKDGLSVLLAGEEVAPVGVEPPPPAFPDRIMSTTGLWPLGRWCRAKLVELLSGAIEL